MQLAALVHEIEDNYLKGNKIGLSNATRENHVQGKDDDHVDGTDAKISFLKNRTVKLTKNDDYRGFYEITKATLPPYLASKNLITSIDIFNLDYIYEHDDSENFDSDKWEKLEMNEMIFPPKPSNDNEHEYYLIRVHRAMPAGNRFMLQSLVTVKTSDRSIETKTYEEIWY